MAYNNYGNQGGYQRGNSGSYSSNRSYNSAPHGKAQAKAEPLPSDYVDVADKVMNAMQGDPRNVVISTSKLRNLFSLFSDLYDTVIRSNAEMLTAAQVKQIAAARVRIVYEVGRDKKGNYDTPVGIFVEKSKLLQYLLDIGDSAEKLKDFYRYFEALVAYHRYYFGEKK